MTLPADVITMSVVTSYATFNISAVSCSVSMSERLVDFILYNGFEI